MHKLDWRVAGEWAPHSHAPQFEFERTSTETVRLVAGVPGGDSLVLLKLIECLAPPVFMLYVLHTPRGEGEAGRYQSPELELGDVRAFVSRFSRFFAGDGRFDLWVGSTIAKETLAWDCHNLLYGYGPVDCFGRALGALGFTEGAPVIPNHHRHLFRKQFDEDALAVLKEYEWLHSPLRPEDEQ